MEKRSSAGVSASPLVVANDITADGIAGMSVVDRLRVYNEIVEEEGKLTPGSLNQMVKWKAAIETVELVISDSMDLTNDEMSSLPPKFYRPVVAEKNVIPREWLEKADLTEFKQLLTMSKNVNAIHLFGNYEDAQNELILNVIKRSPLKLTAFTFYTEDESCHAAIMEVLGKRVGKMEYVNVEILTEVDVKQLIKSNPDIKAIQSGFLHVDFVNCYLGTRGLQDGEEKIGEFWSRMKSGHAISSKLGTNSNLKGLEITIEDDHYIDEIVNSLTHLEFLHIHFDSDEVDLSQLKLKKNIKFLRLVNFGTTGDIHAGEILRNLDKLEELWLRGVTLPHITLVSLKTMCPHLRKLELIGGSGNGRTAETLRAVCELAKLEYYRMATESEDYVMKGEDIAAMRRQLNSTN